MRVEVIAWSRVETRGRQIAFKANIIEVYLDAEEVARYDVAKQTQSEESGFFPLLLDAYTDMKYLSAGKVILPEALREHIHAVVETQEAAAALNVLRPVEEQALALA